MAKLSAFRSDPQRESEGVWVDFEDPETTEKPLSFLIASATLPDYQGAMRRMLRPHARKARRFGDIPQDVLETAQKRCIGRHLLLGWRNMEDDEGHPIEWTRDKAVELMTDPRYRVFFLFVLGVAADEQEYRDVVVGEESKNS